MNRDWRVNQLHEQILTKPLQFRKHGWAYNCMLSQSPLGGHFEGNVVPIVNAFKDALRTAMQTIFRPKCVDYRISNIVPQSENFSAVIIPRNPRKRPSAWTDANTNFCSARQRSHCFCFYETTTVSIPPFRRWQAPLKVSASHFHSGV